MDATTLTSLYQPITSALAETRRIVATLWTDVLQLVNVTDALSGEEAAEGKLLRPALCLLTAGALGERDLVYMSRLAAAYEAIHIASLAHDDVVDHASLRRGRSALNVLWDDHAAVLGGDYLVARSFEMLLEYSCPELLNAALRAMRRMAEGELRFFGKDDTTADESDCIALADAKTASLFAAVCAGPALLLDPEKTEALYQYGINLGIAFQLVDDLLDVTQPSSVLGKPGCGDVAEGKHTLPIFLMRRRMSVDDRQRLKALTGVELEEADREWIMASARTLGIVELVQKRAEAYIETAIGHLESLPPSSCKRSMEELARFVLVRVA